MQIIFSESTRKSAGVTKIIGPLGGIQHLQFCLRSEDTSLCDHIHHVGWSLSDCKQNCGCCTPLSGPILFVEPADFFVDSENMICISVDPVVLV
jgi:hypothetical protein